MKVVVIIPTYNEKDNIAPLINALRKEFGTISHDMNILVVDDNSPDGTAAVVRRECETCRNLCLITGRKQGLGAAYVRGMKYAIQNLSADAVMEMDADFSHKPEDVKSLIAALDNGADFVIGSRYIPGGKIPDDWSFLRRMNSRWGNIFARYIAGMHRVRDCTAGFRAIRAAMINKIGLDSLRVNGYAFQISLLHKAILNQAVVQEVPVEFIDRKYGETKLRITDIIEFMRHACRLRIERSKTFLKFSVVGSTGVIVNLGILTLLINNGVSKYVASPIAIEASIISNFLLNNFWTFGGNRTGDRFPVRGLKFNIVSLATLALSYTVFLGLSLFDPGGMPQVHQAAGIVLGSVVNYRLNSSWTFNKGNKPRGVRNDVG